MQREILFRGFHPCDGPDTIVVDGEKVQGRWAKGFPYFGEYSGAFILQNKLRKCRNAKTGEITLKDDVVPLEVLPSTVGQWTGLTDKNGNRIFEGDIVRRETDYYGKHNIYDEPVVWENDIENDSFGEPYTSGYCIHGGNWEIIGTVFEDHEES